jgi:glycosyltransferase involved in cell wall biosynthesis
MMHVLHVGDDPTLGGGIASVVRRHLSRSLEGVTPSSLPSVNQDATGLWRRNRPFLSAAWVVLRRAPSDELTFHFHLSQDGSLLREGGLATIAHMRGHRALVTTLHGSSTLTMGAAQRFALRRVLTMSSVVHVLSAPHADALASLARPLVVIPNDVDLPEDVRSASDREHTVLFAGVLGRRKGVDLLLGAWPRAAPPGWTLELCGPETTGDARLIHRLLATAPRVRLRGPLTHQQILKSMNEAAVVVLPSRAEALPMSVCEAMAAGCSIVASDVGGTRDLLGQDNPFLVAPEDQDALETALANLMSDAGERERQAVTNRRRAQVLFSPKAIARAWMAVYANLPGPGGARQPQFRSRNRLRSPHRKKKED